MPPPAPRAPLAWATPRAGAATTLKRGREHDEAEDGGGTAPACAPYAPRMRASTGGRAERCNDEQVAESRFRVGDRSRGRYATPADFPRHDGTAYRGLRVRRWGLFIVQGDIFCRAVPSPKATIRDFCIAVGGGGGARQPPFTLRRLNLAMDGVASPARDSPYLRGGGPSVAGGETPVCERAKLWWKQQR
jgi:hypothetical protein